MESRSKKRPPVFAARKRLTRTRGRPQIHGLVGELSFGGGQAGGMIGLVGSSKDWLSRQEHRDKRVPDAGDPGVVLKPG
jgi:hypothetical protein